MSILVLIMTQLIVLPALLINIAVGAYAAVARPSNAWRVVAVLTGATMVSLGLDQLGLLWLAELCGLTSYALLAGHVGGLLVTWNQRRRT